MFGSFQQEEEALQRAQLEAFHLFLARFAALNLAKLVFEPTFEVKEDPNICLPKSPNTSWIYIQPLTNTFDELQKNQHTIVSARNLVVFEFWCQCKLLELECKLHPQAHHEPAILMPECH